MARKAIHLPTPTEVEVARQQFIRQEPRDLFYRVATELIELSIKGEARLSVAEALAVLLQTWNRNYYRFKGGFGEADLQKIEQLVSKHWPTAETLRGRSIESFVPSDHTLVVAMFSDFESGLGPVGAAKSLHLLAPHFFPLWDREITKGYRIWLESGPYNALNYLQFMEYTKRQSESLRASGYMVPGLVKAIDEYNYCTFTLKLKNGDP